MINTTSLILYLDQVLPDSQVAADLSDVLLRSSSKGEAVIELEEAEIYVPYDVSTKIITKALFKDSYNSGFGTLRAQVAIGNIRNPSDGTAFAQYCFATLYYDEDCKLITTDFHSHLR